MKTGQLGTVARKCQARPGGGPSPVQASSSSLIRNYVMGKSGKEYRDKTQNRKKARNRKRGEFDMKRERDDRHAA